MEDGIGREARGGTEAAGHEDDCGGDGQGVPRGVGMCAFGSGSLEQASSSWGFLPHSDRLRQGCGDLLLSPGAARERPL